MDRLLRLQGHIVPRHARPQPAAAAPPPPPASSAPAALASSRAAGLAGKRVVFCGFCQEVSTFNPVPSTREDFVHLRGQQILTGECAGFGYVKGALPVLEAAGVTSVGTYDATAAANGVLDHGEFMAMVDELLQAVRAAVAEGPVDGVYFHLHGAGQTSEDNDPEGYLLAEVRKIIGNVPMVGSFDLHGIITEKMMENLNGLAVQHTYPHVDMPQVGAAAAQQLLALMGDAEGAIAPKLIRVRVPALVRGDNMVTAPHENVGYVDSLMKRIIALEAEPGVIAAALCWGNPFTDVPELLSQVLVLVDR
jgi:microcystin degradation protein MlrC